LKHIFRIQFVFETVLWWEVISGHWHATRWFVRVIRFLKSFSVILYFFYKVYTSVTMVTNSSASTLSFMYYLFIFVSETLQWFICYTSIVYKLYCWNIYHRFLVLFVYFDKLLYAISMHLYLASCWLLSFVDPSLPET